MYNRILKRPMFKRGGPSYQSQGTGITSPFDTPRRQYQFGTSFEEIQENIRKATADNTPVMQDVAQGFSYLASPYKEDGSAKTVGEMIFEGSQAVSGSRAEREKTAQAGELAAQEVGVEKIKSDIAISEAEKERAKDIEIAKLNASNDYLKKTPLPRLILDMTRDIMKSAVPGSFEYKNASGLAKGKAIAAKLQGEGITVGVIEDWVKTKGGGYDYNADNMRSDIPWFDPTKNEWVVFNDDGSGYVTGKPIKSFLTAEEAVSYIKGGNQEIIKDTETLEETNEEEGGKTVTERAREMNKKVKKKGTTYQDMQEGTVQISDIVDKVTDPETWAGTIGGDTRGYSNRGANTYITKKADGGRIGYMDGSDPEATELDMLNNWWRKQLATNWNE
jgi:rubrerythrin